MSGDIEKRDRLTADEIKLLTDHFNKHIGDKSCHICGERDWIASSAIYTPSIFDRILFRHRSDQFRPSVTIVCKNCGVFNEFWTPKVGIITEKPEEEKE